jgi:predicted nucleic acid-binding protein
VILCDSGPLIAAAVSTDAHYRRCVDLFARLRLTGRRLMVPSTVVAEVGYLLEQRVVPRVEAAALQAIADGDFEPVALEADDFTRMARLAA